MGKMGLQLYTIREEAEKDLLGTVANVADMGYDGVQFAGFFNTPATELKTVMDEKGIVAAGAHIGVDQLVGDKLQETFEYNDIIGNDLLICPSLPVDMRKTADDYKKAAELFNQIGDQCKHHGFAFGYHNHNFEFEKFDGQTGFNLLFEHSNSEFVKIELDCAWASFAGYDPLDIIQTYQDRVISLHIKDLKQVGDKKVSTEIGNGFIDFKQLIETGKQHGVQWYTVEQEDYERSPMESAKINASQLKEILADL